MPYLLSSTLPLKPRNTRRQFRELQEKGRIRYADLPLQSKYGERREVEFISKVFRENGRRVVICAIRDISDRKRIQKDKYFLAAIGPLAVTDR
jgi:PAS domain S-box-containing protein